MKLNGSGRRFDSAHLHLSNLYGSALPAFSSDTGTALDVDWDYLVGGARLRQGLETDQATRKTMRVMHVNLTNANDEVFALAAWSLDGAEMALLPNISLDRSQGGLCTWQQPILLIQASDNLGVLTNAYK